MLDTQVSRRPLTRLARLSLVIVGLAFTASIASFAAQSTFSTFTGTVRDQLGGTIPSVTVTLTHAQSGATPATPWWRRSTMPTIPVGPAAR